MDKTKTKAPQVRWELLGERFTAAVLAGNENEAHRQVARLRTNGVPLREIVTNLFAVAAKAVGDGWADDEVSVAVEHRSSEILTRLLGELHPRMPGRRRGVAVVATCQDEHHTLPTTMAAVALREDRWNVEHLGSGVPARGLVRFATDVEADVVVLSVTMSELVEPTQSLARAIARAGIPALVGGPGRTLEELCDLAADAILPD